VHVHGPHVIENDSKVDPGSTRQPQFSTAGIATAAGAQHGGWSGDWMVMPDISKLTIGWQK
jgi:hypothetical protein